MRIWFNHWFSTAYHLINLMREAWPEKLTVVGTNSNNRAVYRRVCDEWYCEKELPIDQYVDFCVHFCAEHAIDVFVPRRGLEGIVFAQERFAALGVKLLMVHDVETVDTLSDKLRTYNLFSEFMPDIIPDYRIVHSVAEFDDACGQMKSESGRLCYKLIIDEGAKSFRVLDDTIESISALYAKPGTKVTYNAVRNIFSGYDFSIPVMVMPYLSGADVSVDCMESEYGRIMIPRYKVGRNSEIRFDSSVPDICNAIMDRFPFDMPANIQFKMEGSKPYLLEINPRMSGGLQLSCKAVDINLPGMALCKLMGREYRFNHVILDTAPVAVVNLETPVIIFE